ncbi:MAG TPA: metal-dependent hydrolase [Thermoanaerobaculia bacterium]
MDPLTHTLVGANLASSKLGQKTALAAAALVIGANLPDVDAILYFTGHQDLALGFRRGWTHGVLALAVLPLLQTALLLLYARARRIAVSPRWLLALSFLAILTHPFLDWLNNYGMRWLMPFRGTWFYGDSVFIMDPWLWLILGCGWLAGRTPSRRLFWVWLFFAAALAFVVGRRSFAYLGIVAAVAIILLLALLWRPKFDAKKLATAALALAFAYIGARLAIHAYVATRVRAEMAGVERLMVAPHPYNPLRWDVVAQTGDVYRFGRWLAGDLQLEDETLPVAKPSPEFAQAIRDPGVRGFMTWVRFPTYTIERTGNETRVRINDARYARRQGLGGAVVVLPRGEQQ